MSQSIEQAIDKLINYLDNNEYISLEEAKIALSTIYPKEKYNTPKERELMLKIVSLISKRTEEAEYFIETITSKRINKEKKKKRGLKCFPFRNSNLKLEKLIIETAYETKPYETIEDLIVNLIYEDIEDPEEVKKEISNFINETGIIIDTSKPFVPEENIDNISYTKVRKNE